MSPRFRTGIQPAATDFTSGPFRIEDAIKRARDLVPSSSDPTSLKQLWKVLYKKYVNDFRAGTTHESFPYWILHIIPKEAIERMIDVVYETNSKKIQHCAPSLLHKFGVPQWQFYLFFGDLHQKKVLELHHLTKKRNVTFDSLYRELCRVRSERRSSWPDGPDNFTQLEIRYCFTDNNGSENEHGSISGHDYPNGDKTPNDTIHVMSSTEGDDDSGSEYQDECGFYDISDNIGNHNPSPESTSSIRLVPGANISSPGPLIIQQLNQDQRGDAISSQDGASMLPSSHVQEEANNTNATTSQRRIELVNALDSFRNKIDSLTTLHEALEREEATNEREANDIAQEWDVVARPFSLLVTSMVFRGESEAAKTNFPRPLELIETFNAVERKRQEHRAKRLRCDADMEELVTKLPRTDC